IVVSFYVFFVSGIIGLCSAAWVLSQVGVPRLPVIILLGTLISTYSHALPYGPIGTTCFLIAVLWIELVWRKSLSREAIAPTTHKHEDLVANVSGGEK